MELLCSPGSLLLRDFLRYWMCHYPLPCIGRILLLDSLRLSRSWLGRWSPACPATTRRAVSRVLGDS
eukprot:3291753-Rhodomonas_salina.1